MLCPDREEALAFQLPCSVGQNLAGAADQPGYHVVQCALAGMPSEVAVSFIIPLKDLPMWLGKTVALPFADVPPPPPGLDVQLGDERFAATLTGEITFEQVDVQGRAFVARLERGVVAWSGALGDKFECTVPPTPLWAVAGLFL